LRFDRDALVRLSRTCSITPKKYARGNGNREILISLASGRSFGDIVGARPWAGHSAGHARKLFRPFARGNREDSPAGLGLGLVLMKALTEAHGGDIKYSDAPGGGALFTVILRDSPGGVLHAFYLTDP